MSELERLWCTIRDTQERVEELETRLSLLEDEEDVTLENWPDEDEEDDDGDFGPVEWDDEDEEYSGLLQDRPNDSDITPERLAGMGVTDESDS